jgi:putative membrane protein
MFYTYHFLGMDLIWWMIWPMLILLFFLFFTPVMKKNIKSTPIEILQLRFSKGEIDIDEYTRRKRLLEKDMHSELRTYFLSASYKIY